MKFKPQRLDTLPHGRVERSSSGVGGDALTWSHQRPTTRGRGACGSTGWSRI